jgi:membrane protease YdiL (CAAX protease family)
MATAVVPGASLGSRKTAAPRWHTTFLIVFFVLFALAGMMLQHGAQGHNELLERRPNLVLMYLSLISGELGLAFYVWRGLRRNGMALRQVIGGRWGSPRAILLDLGLAIGAWLVLQGISMAWEKWVGLGGAASIATMAPRGVLESVLWLTLSASAGFSEELVFRGYLQRQLRSFTGSTWLAVVFQAGMFGIAHSYQGVRNCLFIAIYGAVLTMLALWRKSLRPGMMAHAWTDILGGFLH